MSAQNVRAARGIALAIVSLWVFLIVGSVVAVARDVGVLT